MRYALRAASQTLRRTLVREFGPLPLKAVRPHLVDGKERCRRGHQPPDQRIRSIFKWAVSEELRRPAATKHCVASPPQVRAYLRPRGPADQARGAVAC